MTSSLSIKVTPPAEKQIRDAIAWWSENRSAAPAAIEEELAKAFSLIISQPGVGMPTKSFRIGGVRRLHLGRVRYHLYYKVNKARQVINILAFWHSSRGHGPPL